MSVAEMRHRHFLERLAVVELAKAGAPCRTISAELGVSKRRVQKICHQFGIKLQLPPETRTMIERNERVIEAVRSGGSARAVGDAFGICHKRVQQICARYGPPT